MSAILISSLLTALVGRKVPAALTDFLMDAIPVALDAIRALRGEKGEGHNKAAAVAAVVAELADEHLDTRGLRWSKLPESYRDDMIYGLVEWVYAYEVLTDDTVIRIPIDPIALNRMVLAPLAWVRFFRMAPTRKSSSRKRALRKKILKIFKGKK